MGSVYFCMFSSTSKTKRNIVYSVSLIFIAVVYYMAAYTKLKKNILLAPLEQNWIKKINTDLVLHSIYFDRRPQKSHSNATIIFMSVLEEYRERILGCEVDGVLQVQSEVVDIMLSNWIKINCNTTHTDCFLYCYNVHIQDDTIINVLYNKSGTIMKEPIQTEIVIPSHETEEEAVMVCATGFGEVQHLHEWLTYQRTVGVKFIHLNVNPSFLINLKKSSLLQNLTDTGYIKIVVWEDYLNESQVYYRSQSLKYQDCVLRYQGKYKYMMVIDFDEYFIPLGKSKEILSYAQSLFTKKYGSAELYSPMYYCMAKIVNTTIMPRNGNLTELYDTSISHSKDVGKSLHLVKALELNSVHHFGKLFPSYRFRGQKNSYDSSHCYVAHLKPRRPEGGKECT